MAAPFRIIRFWTDYERKNGTLKPVDKVEYCAIGAAQKSTTVARIADLKRVRETFDPDDVASGMAVERWRVIGTAYDAWKQNNAIPEDGTALAAWPGVTAAQAEVLKAMGLRSVEDVAGAPDSVISRAQLPGMREIQRNAQAFLENKDKTEVAESLSQKDKQIASLQSDLEELRQLVIQQSQNAGDEDLEADGSSKPRRGRPKQTQVAA